MMHVVLNVSAQRLHVVWVAEEMSVVCREYTVRSQDAALELFAYLEKNRSRFASVRIS